jgi:hypothetical protein
MEPEAPSADGSPHLPGGPSEQRSRRTLPQAAPAPAASEPHAGGRTAAAGWEPGQRRPRRHGAGATKGGLTRAAAAQLGAQVGSRSAWGGVRKRQRDTEPGTPPRPATAAGPRLRLAGVPPQAPRETRAEPAPQAEKANRRRSPTAAGGGLRTFAGNNRRDGGKATDANQPAKGCRGSGGLPSLCLIDLLFWLSVAPAPAHTASPGLSPPGPPWAARPIPRPSPRRLGRLAHPSALPLLFYLSVAPAPAHTARVSRRPARPSLGRPAHPSAFPSPPRPPGPSLGPPLGAQDFENQFQIQFENKFQNQSGNQFGNYVPRIDRPVCVRLRAGVRSPDR